MGHKSLECKLPKKIHKANVVNDNTQDVSEIHLFAMVCEANLIGSNPRD